MDAYWSVPTQMTESERFLLSELAQKIDQEGLIVEVGSYLGASTCFLAHGSHGKARSVYAVDTWQNHAMTEGQKDTYAQFLKNTSPFGEIVIPLRGFSTEIAKNFQHEIDLLFLDGDHSYEGLKSDLDAWLPKMKRNGMVVFHDYGWSEGIQKAVQELIFPIQIDGGQCLDSIYWARVNTQKVNEERAPRVSVVIPTLNRATYAFEALNSVIAQKTDITYEIIVIDNGCDPALEQDILKANLESSLSITYRALPELGLHNGRNVGALLSKGEIVVYIDDDVLVSSDWINQIYLPFDDPKVGAVAGKSSPRWEGVPPIWLSQIDQSFLSLLDLGTQTQELQWPQTPFGCNMAVRKCLILGLRGFHPDGTAENGIQWHRGDGETGFTKKVYDAGYKVVYAGKAWLHHRIPAQRLEHDALKSRAEKSAISSFYTKIRNNRYRRWQLATIALISFIKFVKAALYTSLLAPFACSSKRVKADLSSVYNWTAMLYQLRLITDKDLRRWVFRPDYWLSSARLEEIISE